jgi:hypothetical protein
MESDIHRKSLQRSKEILKMSGKGEKSPDEIEEELRAAAQKKIDSAIGIQKKLLALEESQRCKAVIEARALFAEKTVKERAKVELQSAEDEAKKRRADLQVEEDLQEIKDLEKRRLAIEEEKKEMYEAEVFKAKQLQSDYQKMRVLAYQKHCIPAITKSEAQWRESTRLQAAEMAGIAAMSEMKRGSSFFDFPQTDDEIASATVAFFSLPNSKASTTGFLPWVKISDEMATLISSLRVDLFPEVFEFADKTVVSSKKKSATTTSTTTTTTTATAPTATDPGAISTTQPNGTLGNNVNDSNSRQLARKRRKRKKRKNKTEVEKGGKQHQSTKLSSKNNSSLSLFGSIFTAKAENSKKNTKDDADNRGEVTANELKIEAQRQGATGSMITSDGISFSRFAALLHKMLRKEVDSPSLLSKVSMHPKVNLVIPRFRDYHPIALRWLPEFRAAMKIHTTNVKSYDYLGHCELNPFKAVEQMEQLATDFPEKFARGALDAVQLEVSRLFKGRLVVAPEFSIACTMGSNESVRNQEAVRAYLKWITNPLLSSDPVIDPNAEQRRGAVGCVCL